MKKMLFAAALVVSAAVNAQDGARTVAVGVKAGGNLSNLKFVSNDDDDETLESKPGLHIGGFVNVPLGSSFSFNPEVVFSMEGAKEEEDDVEYKINLNYLNIPVLFQYNNVSGFFAETGPQIGILMGAKAQYEFDGEEEEEDVKENFETTNLSWAIGAGYRHTSGLGFNARYNLGLSNIAKDGNDDNKLKANTIQFTISKTF